jgi:alkylhydroperoxidase/carboxymuconolactone decarboxylase family protein YurZ
VADDEPQLTIDQAEMDKAWEYARGYFPDVSHYELLARYRPEMVHGYMTLRQAAYNTGPNAAIPAHMKELIILAIEVGSKKTNPPPVQHAKRAIERGATPQEVAEVISLCIMIGGMLTYREAGRFALAAAEERYLELQAESSQGAGDGPADKG